MYILLCTYIENTLLLKHANHHLSLHQLVVFLLEEGHASVLMAAVCWWLLKAGVTVTIS